MKKLFAIMLALMLVLTMGSALASEVPETQSSFGEVRNDGTFNITKNYTVSSGATFPGETLSFTVAAVNGTQGELPTIASVEVKGTTADIVVDLPEYSTVGVYQYTITEQDGGIAGVTYDTEAYYLTVTVANKYGENNEWQGLVCYPTLAKEGESKVTSITNKYEASSLEVTKEVTGNMGDRSKDFTVYVEFAAPQGDTVKSTISYMDGEETKTVTFADDATKATAEITLKHGETVTFTNIPYGVTYTVTEEDYTKSDGYDAAEYDFSDSNKKIDTTDADTVKITNNKGTQIDTGITTDNLPYIVLMGIVVLAGVAMIAKRRMAHND